MSKTQGVLLNEHWYCILPKSNLNAINHSYHNNEENNYYGTNSVAQALQSDHAYCVSTDSDAHSDHLHEHVGDHAYCLPKHSDEHSVIFDHLDDHSDHLHEHQGDHAYCLQTDSGKHSDHLHEHERANSVAPALQSDQAYCVSTDSDAHSDHLHEHVGDHAYCLPKHSDEHSVIFDHLDDHSDHLHEHHGDHAYCLQTDSGKHSDHLHEHERANSVAPALQSDHAYCLSTDSDAHSDHLHEHDGDHAYCLPTDSDEHSDHLDEHSDNLHEHHGDHAYCLQTDSGKHSDHLHEHEQNTNSVAQTLVNDHSYCLQPKSSDEQCNYTDLAPSAEKGKKRKSSYHMHELDKQNKKSISEKMSKSSTSESLPSKPLFDIESCNIPYNVVNINGEQKKSFSIPGDGNCFFHSLSLSFNGNFSMGPQYRKQICEYILENWELWKDSISVTHEIGINSQTAYKSHMLKKNGYATATEIQAACIILKINIAVWLHGIRFDKSTRSFKEHYTLQTYSDDNTIQTIELLLSSCHFTVLSKHKHHERVTSKHKQEVQNNLDTHNETNNFKRKTQSHSDTQQSKRIKKEEKVHNSNFKKDNNTQPKSKPKERVIYKYAYVNNHEQNSDLLSQEADTFQKCRKLGLPFLLPDIDESKQHRNTRKKLNTARISAAEMKYGVNVNLIPPAPPLSDDTNFNTAMDCIRAFELEQMSYSIQHCLICNERRVQMKMASQNVCLRCNSDKGAVKLFSKENFMDPKEVPEELRDMTLIEHQLISRLAPVINVHLLKHGGIAANGHCVTFPQCVNEPAQILPLLPEEIKIIRVRKCGSDESSKEFNVRRNKVGKALYWLKSNNPAFSDIIISQERLTKLPVNAAVQVQTIDTAHDAARFDKGPAEEQTDPGEVQGETISCVSLPDQNMDIKQRVEQVVKEVVGPEHGKVTEGRKFICIPWPTQNDTPLSEFTTRYLFPYGNGDFHINRPRTISSMTDWAEHLMWHEDGRFAQHPYFKFIVHNIIMRKRTLEQSSYVVKQHLGEEPITIPDLKDMLQKGDNSVAQKVMYFGACLRGTSQYWAQRHKELRSLIQFKINEGQGLPSFFTTGSCAEYHFKPLKRLLSEYCTQTTGQNIDLDNRNNMFIALQKNTHIVSSYFDLRTQCYFKTVMKNVFGVDTYWYRQEFAKSRGMIHWHGLCWRDDREPHNLVYEALQHGLDEDQCASILSDWAKMQFGMTALHPAGKDKDNKPQTHMWPPPEGTAEAPPEEKNPLIKLLMDVSDKQESLLEDHILLTNRINLHRCSAYCLRQNKGQKTCRMEFGSETNPGKQIRNSPAIVRDKNQSLRLEMERDHPMLVQHSRYHTQGWRANGDISLILSKSSPENPSVNEIIATEKYITGYACKGNEQTGAVADLFQDIVKTADDTTGASTKSVCTKLLMNTVKRDVSSMEAAYELLSLPLYRCSHDFQNVSFTGSRVLEKKGYTLTKSTPLDKYIARPKDQVCSWYQYICDQGKVPVVSGASVRATYPLNEDYCRSMLLLHWPNWRKLTDIKGNETWLEAFQQFVATEVCPNFVKADVERAQRHISTEISNDDESDDPDENSDEQPEWMSLLQPRPNFKDDTEDQQFDDGGPNHDWSVANKQYPVGYGLKWLESLSEHKEIINNIFPIDTQTLKSLNDKQKFAFNIVLTKLIEYQKDPSSTEPLHLVIAGTAGSGKSFLIKCLVFAIRKLFNNTNVVQVLCPTGNSANLIQGRTIHDFLKIPTGRKSTKEMVVPDGTIGQTLQDNCSELKALIIDERSLVGCKTLGWMEFHTKVGMKSLDKCWGGLPVVIFLGDDVQLPPVCDTPVFSTTSSSPAGMHGALVWKEFQNVVELVSIERQDKDQQRLKKVLMSLRQYQVVQDDATWLQQFQWDNMKLKFGEPFMKEMTENSIFVFPTHNLESIHNSKQLLKANEHAAVAKVSAINKGPHAKTAQADKAGGLLDTFFVCVGSKVILTSNICVHYGLFNGSMGVVQDILYLDGRSPQNSLPDVIMVSFPKYNGPPFLPDHPTTVPVVPIERKIDCFCFSCKRKQVPLRLGWGTTIHRCQGMTIGKGEVNRYIVIHPGSNKFECRNPGALFVALSRAKSAGGEKEPPDFAWNQDILVNEDRLCLKVNTPSHKVKK